MVNIQAWVDRQYPTPAEKAKVWKLYLDEPNLEGELDLTWFTYQRGCKIAISPQVDETKLIFKNKPKTVEIRFYKAQAAFDREYPINGSCLGELNVGNKDKNRRLISRINFFIDYNEHLEGSLVIKDFLRLREIDLRGNKLTVLTLINCPQVRKIECWSNKLTSLIVSHPEMVTNLNISDNQFSDTLDLSQFKNLAKLDCSFNQLTNLNWATLPVSLTELDIRVNKFSGDLAVLSQLVNLEYLNIAGNKFTGSLEPLKNLTKLIELNINQTQLTTGLEYLPESVTSLRCHANQFPELVKYSYQTWRKESQNLIASFLPLQPLYQNIQSLLLLNKSFILQQQQLANIQHKMQYANYAQYLLGTIGATGGLAGAYQSIPGGYASGLSGFLGAFVAFKINESWKKKLAEIESRWGNQQELAQEIKAKFMESISELEKNYHQLVALHQDLSILDTSIISSNRPALKQSIEKFLTTLATLKEDLEKNECFKTDIEMGWRTISEAKQYFETLQKNWVKLEMNKVISELIQETISYHQALTGLKVVEENNLNQSTQNLSLTDNNQEESYELQQIIVDPNSLRN